MLPFPWEDEHLRRRIVLQRMPLFGDDARVSVPPKETHRRRGDQPRPPRVRLDDPTFGCSALPVSSRHSPPVTAMWMHSSASQSAWHACEVAQVTGALRGGCHHCKSQIAHGAMARQASA